MRHAFLSPLLLVACALTLHTACSKPPPTEKTQFEGALPAALEAHSQEFKREVIEVSPGIQVAIGFGIANVIQIDAPQGRIIVDTLETLEQAKAARVELEKYSAKPIAAIIYTHNHPDHVYGAAAFDDSGTTPIYAHAKTAGLMDELVSMIRPIMNRRSAHMYGTLLTGSAFGNVGIGPFVGMFDPGATLETRRPTVTFEERLEVTVAGEKLVLIHAPGETEDQIYVWLPDRKTLLSGDNYYKAFPNLYTVRGTSWRNPVRWYRSLDIIRGLEPEFLIPSHTRPLVGRENIRAIITDYRDAIQYVHDQTLRGMNAGKTPDELAASIRLPAHLEKSPYLQEFYGSVPWCVRAVYSGYLGWFDGRATTLRPLAPDARAQRMVTLAGGKAALQKQAADAAQSADWQWVLELTDVLLRVDPAAQDAKTLRIQALKALGEREGNPNARHWFYTEALELEQNIVATLVNNPTPKLVQAIPLRVLFESLVVNLHAEDTLELNQTANFVFPDAGETYSVTIRRGIAELRAEAAPAPDLTVTVSSVVWKEMLAGLRNRVAVLASGDLKAEPGLTAYAAFMRHFLPD